MESQESLAPVSSIENTLADIHQRMSECLELIREILNDSSASDCSSEEE